MPQASRAARVEHFTKDMPKEIPNSSLQPKLFSKPDEFSASVEDIASTFQFGAPLSINPGQFVREVRGQSPSNGQDISLEPEAQLGSPRLIDSGISDQNLVGSVNRNLPGFQGGKHPRPITIGSGHAESCGLSVDLAQRHPLSGAMARQEMSFNKNNTGRLPTDGKGRDIYRDNTGQSKPQEKELFSFTLLPNPTSSQSINFDYDAAHTKRQRLGARNGAEDTSKQSKQDVLLQQYHDKYANRARRYVVRGAISLLALVLNFRTGQRISYPTLTLARNPTSHRERCLTMMQRVWIRYPRRFKQLASSALRLMTSPFRLREYFRALIKAALDAQVDTKWPVDQRDNSQRLQDSVVGPSHASQTCPIWPDTGHLITRTDIVIARTAIAARERRLRKGIRQNSLGFGTNSQQRLETPRMPSSERQSFESTSLSGDYLLKPSKYLPTWLRSKRKTRR